LVFGVASLAGLTPAPLVRLAPRFVPFRMLVIVWARGMSLLAMPIRFSRCYRFSGQKKKGLALARPFVG
jgi:hypothetical protein